MGRLVSLTGYAGCCRLVGCKRTLWVLLHEASIIATKKEGRNEDDRVFHSKKNCR